MDGTGGAANAVCVKKDLAVGGDAGVLTYSADAVGVEKATFLL